MRSTNTLAAFCFRCLWMASSCLATLCSACFADDRPKSERPNVLLILVDDLKPALACYGDTVAQTPHLDALAARGMRFDAAYCNQAVCAPSRFTLMLGSHSTSTGLYGLDSQLRKVLPDAVTLPQYFARHGYRTESLGKVFHVGHGNYGDPDSFSVPHFHDKVIEYADPASTDGGLLTREEAYFTNQRLGEIRSLPRGAAFESPDVADEAYADGRVAAETVRRLKAAKARRDADGTPFFIAAGFARPHLPFSAPKKYWDLYDPRSLPMPRHEELPRGAPAVAGKRGGEIANYEPVPEDANAAFPASIKRSLIHGYYASVSYVDTQIGKIVNAVDALGLADETIIVLWGDHGFHLGDLGIWTKHTNYEQANRIPIVIVAPGATKPNQATSQLAESVDLYPTLAELAGLPAPTGPQPIDGVSLVPVLKDPDVRVRDHAYHAYPKRLLGRAIRTAGYRMVQWKTPGADDETAEYELYDYTTDLDETENLATKLPEVLEELKRILARYPEGYQSSNPFSGGATKQTVFGLPKRITKSDTPNIIVVFIDDMGFTDLSCFGGEQTTTEHIDRLACEGLRFTNFYVNSPICSPSRTALTTGQYPQRWRITSFLNNRQSNKDRGMAQWLDPRAPVLARELQRRGYFTGHFGKWHMGGQRDVGDAPLISEYGFDRSLTNFEGLGPRVLGYKNAFKGGKPKLHHLGSNDLGNGPIQYADRSVITTKFVERAIEHINQAVTKEQPFFINVWPDDVHSPFFPPKELREATDESTRQLYYAVLDALDQQLAPLFDRVRKDEQLRGRTLILLCSDNGHEPGAGTSDPLRGSKALLYEGGIRSPLIVWGPGIIDAKAAGTVNETSVFSAIDVNRTLYALTGTPVPDGVTLDGENVLDTMLGKSTRGRKAPIFFRRPPDRPGGGTGGNKDAASEADAPDLAVRDGRWKFLVNYDGSNPQLFDLIADPAESTNLFRKHPDVADRLRKAVFQWNAGLPADAGDPNRERNHANASMSPLVRTVDLDIGDTVMTELSNGNRVRIRLLNLKETRDPIRQAVRSAKVTVEVDGQEITLESGMYNLPMPVANVQIDSPVTSGYNSNGTPSFWGLDKAARLRVWPAGSPLITPGSFIYPVDQRWFATRTWFDNETVDGGARILPKIYYHSGLDIGASEAQTKVIAATDALVVSVGDDVLEGHRKDTPVAARYDVVYLLDQRGWYYRYSHLHEINDKLLPGRFIGQGTEIGLVGKKGASGGWSHLHFEIKSRQPSGKWGTQAGYAFLWEAYRNRYKPVLVANARRKSFLLAGEAATLDASKSWSATDSIRSYEWTFSDGSRASGPTVTRIYSKPGFYSEILKVTDNAGNVDYDFAEVHVVNPETPDRYAPGIHAVCWPTFGNRVNQPITFKVRSFREAFGEEVWDFGDGSPAVSVKSDGNVDPHAKDGYAVTQHTYRRAGDYLVRVQRKTESGQTATARLHVRVAAE